MALEHALVSTSSQPIQQQQTIQGNPTLENLNDLLHSRAEVFACPSTSYATGGGREIYEATLKATKYLFDNSLKAEPQSLKLLSKLLSDIRDSSYSPRIETRSKAAAAAQRSSSDIKGKGKAAGASSWLSNPLFRPTPLQELYIDENNTSNAIDGSAASSAVASTSTISKSNVDAELELQMLWEQLEHRNEKVLQIVKEIVHDGDESDDDAENGEGLDDDDEDDEDEDEFGLEGEEEDEEMLDGLEDDEDDDEGEDLYDGSDSLDDEDMEDDESLDDEEDDDEDEPSSSRKPSAPYFAKLRDASPSTESSPVKSNNNTKSGGKKVASPKKGGEPTTIKAETEADDGLFSLKDFNSQVLAGEDEMKRYISSGKSKSINDLRSGIDGLEDMDDSDNEEVDYFAPPSSSAGAGDAGIGSDDDDEDEDEDEEEGDGDGGMRPEDMRYNDFWEAPTKVYTKRRDDDYAPGGKGKNSKGKGKAPQQHQANPKSAKGKPTPAESTVSAGQNEAESSMSNGKAKRRVSFNDQVKVQEFESANGPQSAFAQLVKAVGTKEALRRLKEGEFEDDDAVVANEDGEDDEVNEEDLTEEEMQALLDGEYGSSDEEEDEDGEDDDEDEEEEEDDDDISEASDESAHQGALTMRRLQKDLLSEDADDSSAVSKKKKGQQSRYEARMAALSEQIAGLEAENVAEREWTMRGEVNARARPQNSLLEEDLEFDQAAKVVPVVTEESSLSLEDMIKKRIIDDRFDDVVRKSAIEPAAYIPSRLLDIKDTQNERSLAEIYADEFSAERRRTNGEEAETPEIDSKLAKEHDAIRSIFEEICTKLDSLSNAHFTPQAAQTTITTISNAPSISMESAMPAAMSAASGLAPEEVYAPEQNGTLTARSEMTPSQKKAARAKARKARMQTQKVIDKYGGKSRNDKQAKERAMNSLIGKRGVTVVGKGKATKSALTGQDRRVRGSGPDTTGMSGAKFKL